MESIIRKKVLIVDDEKGITIFIKKVLDKWPLKYSVTTVNSGFEAIKVANDILPDIVILDLKIPDIDGFEICRNIRKNEKLKHTKVIAMSGSITSEIENQILSCGADDYLSKPFDIKTFITKLEKLYEK